MTAQEDRERKRLFARRACYVCGVAMLVLFAADAVIRYLYHFGYLR